MTGHHVHVDLPTPQAREAIGEEIARYSWHILNLKSTLNALTPISTLPPEILCEIFLYTAGVDIHEQYVVKERRKSYGWICVSHVCRHWRAVALSCPSLWSRLDVKAASRELLETLLVRSRGAPLIVSYTGWGRRSTPAIPWSEQEAIAMVLESHLQRTRSLSLSVSHQDQNTVLNMLSGPSPLLESLELHCDTSSAVSHVAYAQVHELLHHPETRVRCLKLHYFSMRWPTVNLPHLTRLNITGGQSSATQQDIGHLLIALASMQALEELTLDRSVTLPFDGTMSDVSAQVVLSRLRTLCLHDYMPECIAVLNQLNTPSLLCLDLEVHTRTEYASLHSEVAAAIVTKTHSMQTFQALAINIRSNYPHQARVSAYTEANPDIAVQSAFPLDSRPDQANLKVSFCPMGAGGDRMATELCRLLPVDEVRSLYVTGATTPESLWATVLTRTDKVTMLYACSSSPYGTVLPETLLRKQSRSRQALDDTEEHNHPYILPQLRSLTLEDYYFALCDPRELSSREECDDEDSDEEEGGRLVTRLVNCLVERSERGAGIEELCISRPVNATGEEIHRLESTVAVFKWDGQLKFDYYYDDEEETDLDDEDDEDDDEDEDEDEEDNYSVTSADLFGSDNGYYGFY